MSMRNRISDDISDLRIYFHKIFDVVTTSTEFSELRRFKSNIKLDMICNTYSCLDFWLKEICKQKQRSLKLRSNYKSVKADDDLDAYHKYLTEVACIDMTDVKNDFENIQILRLIRNNIIHAGSHVAEINKITNIQGVTFQESLICVTKEYVIGSLNEVEKYLLRASDT
jgi:hypothetical protein